MKQRELIILKDQKCWQSLVRQTHKKRRQSINIRNIRNELENIIRDPEDSIKIKRAYIEQICIYKFYILDKIYELLIYYELL